VAYGDSIGLLLMIVSWSQGSSGSWARVLRKLESKRPAHWFIVVGISLGQADGYAGREPGTCASIRLLDCARKGLRRLVVLRRVDLKSFQRSRTQRCNRIGVRQQNFEHSHVPDFAMRTAIDRVGFCLV
jgi:hypothetical protein